MKLICLMGHLNHLTKAALRQDTPEAPGEGSHAGALPRQGLGHSATHEHSRLHPQHTPTAPSLPLILLPSTRSTWPHVVLPAHSQHVLCSRQTLLLPTFLRLRFTPIPRTCAPLTLAEGWELMRLFSAVLGRIA